MTEKEQIKDFIKKKLKKTEHLEKLYGRSTRTCLEINIYSELISYIDSMHNEPNYWKPSDEQMEALDDFIYAKYPNVEKYGAAVKSLYQDLKKLREE